MFVLVCCWCSKPYDYLSTYLQNILRETVRKTMFNCNSLHQQYLFVSLSLQYWNFLENPVYWCLSMSRRTNESSFKCVPWLTGAMFGVEINFEFLKLLENQDLIWNGWTHVRKSRYICWNFLQNHSLVIDFFYLGYSHIHCQIGERSPLRTDSTDCCQIFGVYLNSIFVYCINCLFYEKKCLVRS